MKASSKSVAILMLAGLLAWDVTLATDSLAQDSKTQNIKPADANGQEKTQEKAQDQNEQNPPASQIPSGSNVNVCEVPAYLLTTENSLPKVTEVIKNRQRLDILVVGSASSALAGPNGATHSYPARFEAALREKLTNIPIHVTTDLQIKKTAADVTKELINLVKDRKPLLVIWQTGTVDAVRSVDPDDFRTAIDQGIAALQRTGTDVLLMNLQYSLHVGTMLSVAPYLDNMRVAAQEYNVPLFDRFAIMRHWSESGLFDLFNSAQGLMIAERVHDCLGQALAMFVIDATHMNAAKFRIQP